MEQQAQQNKDRGPTGDVLVAASIKKNRRRLRLTQNDLVRRFQEHGMRVTKQSVSHWECSVRMPGIRSLQVMAKIFGCTIDDILEGPTATAMRNMRRD